MRYINLRFTYLLTYLLTRDTHLWGVYIPHFGQILLNFGIMFIVYLQVDPDGR